MTAETFWLETNDRSGLFVHQWLPAGTPKAIVETLHTALRKSNDSPESVQLHLSAGTQPLNMPLSEGQKFVDEEIARWARYVKASGVKPE